MSCKYCGEEGWGWCCPACYEDFEADRGCEDSDDYSDDREEEEYDKEVLDV